MTELSSSGTTEGGEGGGEEGAAALPTSAIEVDMKAGIDMEPASCRADKGAMAAGEDDGMMNAFGGRSSGGGGRRGEDED